MKIKVVATAMFPLDPVWLLAGAALAAMFALAGSVLAVYAVRRRGPVLGAVLSKLVVGQQKSHLRLPFSENTATTFDRHRERGRQMVGHRVSARDALLSAAKEAVPNIDWGLMPVSGPAIIGALPDKEGSVLVCQYSANIYTLRHNGRMVRNDLTSIADVCAAIASLVDKSGLPGERLKRLKGTAEQVAIT